MNESKFLNQVVMNLAEVQGMGENNMTTKTFWDYEFSGKCKTGIYYRAFDLIEFFKKIEAKTNEKIVGLEFDYESHNLHVIISAKEDNEHEKMP